MFDLRTRLGFLIGIPLIIVISLVLFLILRPDTKLPDNTDLENQQNLDASAQIDTSGGESEPGVLQPSKMPAYVPSSNEERSDIYATQVARNFVERFYSYSNQNNNSHLEDVLPLATDSMGRYVLTQKIDFNKVYEGVTTKVIESKLSSRGVSEAKVNIGVQQIVTKGGETNTIYKKGRVELMLVGADWKVNAVYWD